MGHFAQLDDQDQVLQVIVIGNNAMDGLPFPESEPVGQTVIAESGIPGNWKQCSYNANFRGCFPAAGYTYDPVLDVFVPPSAPEPPVES